MLNTNIGIKHIVRYTLQTGKISFKFGLIQSMWSSDILLFLIIKCRYLSDTSSTFRLCAVSVIMCF